MMTLCPCSSKQNYQDCCAPFIERKQSAPTAVALMRSRFTAYALSEVDYLIKTWAPPSEETADPAELKRWTDEATFLELEIIATEKGKESDDSGIVEFVAHYKQNGKTHQLHERSLFRKINGYWVYTAGDVKQTPGTKSKISRNAPCPCGSGEKYKRCCLDVS